MIVNNWQLDIMPGSIVVVIMSYPAHDDAKEYMQDSAIGPLIYNPLHGRDLNYNRIVCHTVEMEFSLKLMRWAIHRQLK